jgi:basic amino acid/polyamine antiporter, APA family
VPTWMPVIGAIVCLILILPITGRSAAVYTRAVVLIAIGVALWFVNRIFVQKAAESRLATVARPK